MRGYSIAVVSGRGAGLGNEVIPWAKAAIAAEVFGIQLVAPAWGLNARGYAREFRTSRFDWVRTKALTTLPGIDVDTDLLISTGHPFDYWQAMTVLRSRLEEQRAVVLRHHGMHGGFFGIRHAKPFLRQMLLSQPRPLFEELPTGPRVVLHVRADDFERSATGPSPGEFNKRIPISWYQAVARQIMGECPTANFKIVTDGHSDDIAALQATIGAAATEYVPTVLGDLDTMVHADLLVCSVSSFSTLAAFMSDRPYVWFQPHLHQEGGWQSIWGYESLQRSGPTAANCLHSQNEWGRGFALHGNEPQLPDPLRAYLETCERLRELRNDLVFYGVTASVPEA